MKKRDFRKQKLQRPEYPCGKDLVLGRREVVKSLGWFFGLSAVGVNLLACTESYGDGDGDGDGPGDEDDRGWSQGVAPPYDADAGWYDVPDGKPDRQVEDETFETQGVAPNYYYDADLGTDDGVVPDFHDFGDTSDIDDESDVDDGDAAETE